ncbi:MAG: tetratricopeptide repeat protein [bacterium]
MKKLIMLSLVLSLGIGSAYSQVPSSVGAALGQNLFFGDSRLSASELMPNFNVYSSFRIAPRFSLKLQAGFSQMKSVVTGHAARTYMAPIEIRGMYSLMESPTFPFLEAGIGVINFTKHKFATYEWNNSWGGLVSGGLGMNFSIDPNLSLVVSANFNYTTHDHFNGFRGGLNDGFITFQTGFIYNLSGKQKRFEKKDSIPQSRILAQPSPAKTKKNDLYTDLIQLRSRIDALEREIDAKNSRIEELIVMIDDKNQKIGGLEQQVASLNEPSQMTAQAVEPEESVEIPEQPVKLHVSQVKQKYDLAITNFNNKNYRAAILGLTDLSEDNPNHALASNFVYWIGESYFALKDYKQALSSFENVQTHNNSTKFDYALYMAGRCYQKLNDTANAAQKFGALLQKYPNSVLAEKAAKKIQVLGPKVIS